MWSGEKTLPEAVKAAQKAELSEADINRVLVYGYDIRISARNVVELLEILTEARKQRYPVEIIFNKIDEGLAKRVSFEIIKSVLKKKIRDFRYILNLYQINPQTIVPQKQSQSFLLASESLEFGLSNEDLAALRQDSRDVPIEMFALAANNLALLRQLGFDPGLAQKIMRIGLENKSLTPDWKNFFKVVENAKKRGIFDLKIFDAAARLLAEKKNMRVLLKELGFTDRDLRRGPMNPKGAR